MLFLHPTDLLLLSFAGEVVETILLTNQDRSSSVLTLKTSNGVWFETIRLSQDEAAALDLFWSLSVIPTAAVIVYGGSTQVARL